MENGSIFSEKAFAGKTAIITGGAGDIAFEIAMDFAKAGISKIALLDIDGKLLDEAVAKLKEAGAHAIKVQVDLTSREKLHAAVEGLKKAEGEAWDILVTTAGLYIGTPLIESKWEDFQRLMEVNALSVLEVSKLFARGMIEREYGKVIHIGSSSTYFGTPGSGIYAASKVVVNQLTQTMAIEWGPHNVQVNTICPTVTETKFLNPLKKDPMHTKLRERLKERIPLKRLLKVEDIAPLVLFLASDEAQFINGAIIPIDGGSRLK